MYGLSEFHRHELREARLVATPGCFPTGALLALLPLIRRDLIEPSSIIIDAKSGTTGARRAASIEQLFAEVNENFRAYKVGNHRHVPEMEQEISAALGRDIALLFVPHLLPITRGLLSSIFMRPRAGTTESDVHAAFEASFAKSRFVRILKPGELPELRNVRATNYCELGVHPRSPQRDAAGDHRDRQPRQRCVGPGNTEHEPDARLRRSRRPPERRASPLKLTILPLPSGVPRPLFHGRGGRAQRGRLVRVLGACKTLARPEA